MSLLGKATILPIQSTDIGHYQKIAIPFIQVALEQTDGEETLSGILSGIANHKRQLWLIKAEDEFIAAVVTMTYTTDSGLKIGEITLAGGRDYHLWDHYSDVIGEWMREQGCKIMQVIGRLGWEKHLVKKNFKKRYIVFRRDLTHG